MTPLYQQMQDHLRRLEEDAAAIKQSRAHTKYLLLPWLLLWPIGLAWHWAIALAIFLAFGFVYATSVYITWVHDLNARDRIANAEAQLAEMDPHAEA